MNKLHEIGERIRTQDNRSTADPMFLVQKLVVDSGYDSGYTDNYCWWNPELLKVVYDDEPEGEGWEGPFGYKTRWETVMTAFTQAGCEEYLELDGHNVRHVAHEGKVRIYCAYYGRCPEMVAIRAGLIQASESTEKFMRELAVTQKCDKVSGDWEKVAAHAYALADAMDCKKTFTERASKATEDA